VVFVSLDVVKRLLLHLLVCLIGFVPNLWAQNFNTVVADSTHYFFSEEETLVGLRVDSSATVNGYLEHYFHREFRARHHESTSGCGYIEPTQYHVPVDLYGPSWMGFKCVELSDSIVAYFNYLSDTIFIRPLDSVGSTWIVFNHELGGSINAEVVDVVSELVAGQNQLVKVLELQEFDAVGQPVPGNWNGVQWKLSEHHGWKEIHSLYLFPEFERTDNVFHENLLRVDKMEMHDTTILMLSEELPPTMRQMFDYSPEAIYQVTSSSYFDNGGFPQVDIDYSEFLVVLEYDHGDSINYQVNGSTWMLRNANMVFPNGFLPFQYYKGTPLGAINWLNYDFDESIIIVGQPMDTIPSRPQNIPDCDQLAWSMYKLSFNYAMTSPNDSICGYYLDCAYQELVHYNHLIAHDLSYGCFESNWDVHNNFMQSEWCNFGSFVNGVDEQNLTTLILYPNPTTSTITLQTETPLSQAWLTDLTGRRLMPLQLNGTQWQADLSQLPSGMYLINVLTEEGRRGVKKVVRE